LDTNDGLIKPGMSATLNIITNVAQDALMVPNSAVKTQGAEKYVQVLINGVPQIKTVTVGLANNTSTQILSGLNAGDQVITQTNTSAVKTTTGASTIRIPGLSVGGGFRGN